MISFFVIGDAADTLRKLVYRLLENTEVARRSRKSVPEADEPGSGSGGGAARVCFFSPFILFHTLYIILYNNLAQ